MRSEVAGEKKSKWAVPPPSAPRWSARAAATASRIAKKTAAPRKNGGSPTAFDECTARNPAAACAARLARVGALGEGAYSLLLREWMRALPASQLRLLRAEDAAREPARALEEALAFLELRATVDGSPAAALLRRLDPVLAARAARRTMGAEAEAEAEAESEAEAEAEAAEAEAAKARASGAALRGEWRRDGGRGGARGGADASSALLRDFYAEYNAELVSLMDGDARFGWPARPPGPN